MKVHCNGNVTVEERSQFRRDGVVCLHDSIAPEWIEIAREGIEDQRRSPTPYATVVEKDGLYLLIDQMPTCSKSEAQARRVRIGRRRSREAVDRGRSGWIYDQLFYKESGQVPETPWHQDTVYGFLDGPKIVRVWMPVDHVPRQTSLEVVRGSHLWNIEYDIIEHIAVLEENVEHTKASKFNYLETRADTRPKNPRTSKQTASRSTSWVMRSIRVMLSHSTITSCIMLARG